MTATQTSPRTGWVDALRGVAIILVLLGHAPVPPAFKALVYSFHMPLFFLLGGLFLNPQMPFARFAQDKWQRLMVPYFLFSMLSYLVWLGIRPFSSQAAGIDAMTPLQGVLYGVDVGHWMAANPPLWFLPCLFSALLMAYGILRHAGRYIVPVLSLVGLLGLWLPTVQAVRPPWSLDVALTAAVFVSLGALLRNGLLSHLPLPRPARLLCMALWMLAACLNTRVDMNHAQFGHPGLFYLAALSGSLWCFDAACRLGAVPWLAALGQRTMPVFCLHMLVYLAVTACFKLAGYPIALTYEGLQRVNPGFDAWLATLAYVMPGLTIPLALAILHEKLVAARLRPGRWPVPEVSLGMQWRQDGGG